MTQYDFTINPATQGGAALAAALLAWEPALLSNHAGAARPGYAVADMLWVKVVSATAHEVYLFDGTDDILMGTFDTTNNRFSMTTLYDFYSNSGNAIINPAGTPVDGMSYDRATTQMNLSRSAGAALRIARHGSDGVLEQFYRNNVSVGGISVTTTATTFITSSDYRLKYDVERLTDLGELPVDGIAGPLGKLMQLKPSRYHMYADEGAVWHYGFIAHELQEHVPHAVTGMKDATEEQSVQIGEMDDPNDVDGPKLAVMETRHTPIYQGVDTSQLVTMLVASVQQLTARVIALETKEANA